MRGESKAKTRRLVTLPALLMRIVVLLLIGVAARVATVIGLFVYFTLTLELSAAEGLAEFKRFLGGIEFQFRKNRVLEVLVLGPLLENLLLLLLEIKKSLGRWLGIAVIFLYAYASHEFAFGTGPQTAFMFGVFALVYLYVRRTGSWKQAYLASVVVHVGINLSFVFLKPAY